MNIVIMGAGHAGVQLAVALRRRGFDGRLDLVAAEGLPYQRPPLSKDYLLRKTTRDALYFRKADYYLSQHIQLHLKEPVIEINRTEQWVKTTQQQLAYDHLVIATGSINRVLDCEGVDQNRVHQLRNLSDADALFEALATHQRWGVIGSGFVGLEFAATAAKLGRSVQVFGKHPQLMARVIPERISSKFQQQHEAQGVQFHLDLQTIKVTQPFDGALSISNHSAFLAEVDAILVGIGATANDTLARQAGLDCDNGIVVNGQLQSSDPNISAIGDCANHPNPFWSQRMRLESVQNATDQAELLAARLTGQPTSDYDAVPWFWTQQYDWKLQMAGCNINPDQTLIRGDSNGETFSLIHLKSERIIGVDSLNSPADHMGARKLILKGDKADISALQDRSVSLISLAKA